MCGILAVADLNNRSLSETTVRRLRDTMIHRGPDDAGLFIDGPVALGHRRLSIIDLSPAGHQPMSNEDGTVQLVFNGEIYNYIELREDLRNRGHIFRSASDTEVLLRQYLEDGEACVHKLRGMFAFVIWDSRRGRLFAARDRLGIKPLYYYRDQNRILLASEIKAIIEDDSVPRRPDMCALADYLYAGRPLGRKTMFDGVTELEPGHQMSVDIIGGIFEVKKYWDLRFDYVQTRSDSDTVEGLFSLVNDAVKVHCRSDAPLGCHLSGGIDSSTVAAFAARHRQHLPTFSIKFSDDEHIDETAYARAVACHVGADYYQSSPTASDLAELLALMVWHMDAPLVSDGAFGYLAVSDFAKRHAKVSLTGHGGDEVFAGYPAQFQAAFGATDMFELQRDPDRLPRNTGLWRRAFRRGPIGLYESLRARSATSTPSLEDTWVALHCDRPPAKNPALHASFIRQLSDYSPRESYVAPLSAAPTDQTLDKCLYHDIRVYLPSLLQLEDRLSMAVSLESRVPLLDHHIVEFMATVPPEQKVRGLRPKHLLREVSSRVLPESVWQNRQKRGFPVPGKFWRTKQLTDTIRRILLSEESLERHIFSPDSLRSLCQPPIHISLVWPLINVELWFRLFIDKDSYWLQKAKGTRVAII